MRTLAKILILASAAAGVAVIGVAGPAHADTVKCAERPLRPEAPDIVIVTCAEATGDQRRSLSTVINGTDQAIELREFKTLISYPQYGLTDCGASRLDAGTQAVCISPWVTARGPSEAGRASAFSIVRVIEAEGRHTFAIGVIDATF
jgi:hypothetical protein